MVPPPGQACVTNFSAGAALCTVPDTAAAMPGLVHYKDTLDVGCS